MQDAGCRHEEAKPNLLEMKEIIGELLEFPSGLLKQFKGGNVGHGQLTCTLYRGKKKDLRSELSLSQSIVSLSTQSSGLSIPQHFLHAALLRYSAGEKQPLEFCHHLSGGYKGTGDLDSLKELCIR